MLEWIRTGVLDDDGGEVEIAREIVFQRPILIAFGIMYENFAIVWRLL